MTTLAMEICKVRASEQQIQLHQIASDLRRTIQGTRDELGLTKQARDHLELLSFVAGLLGVAAGYGFAGLFTTSASLRFELPMENKACRF